MPDNYKRYNEKLNAKNKPSKMNEENINEPNQIFKRCTTVYDKEILYRGDIKDKGETFSEASDTKDYLIDGKVKNKAGFHWFTGAKKYAEEYATKQMSQFRGEIQTQILTKIETKKINLLDFTKMTLEDQVNFAKSTIKFGLKEQMYNEDKLLAYDGKITEANIDKVLGGKTYGNILEPGQIYSDGDKGVLFKEWLIENGFDGYRFKMFVSGDEIGLINAKKFTVKERIKL
jgi:hypothetical protein